ncbi:MAG: HigA family addiction module antidote protein [Gammaproteobacteria bacterium]|nr:HigA family addiction module antidote protein [Gammaproteobacteria bacterium]
MSAYNPTHPGETLRDCIDDSDLTITDTAREMGISRTTLYRVLSGKQPITAGLALALERMGWSNAEFWMRRQANFDLAVARKKAA